MVVSRNKSSLALFSILFIYFTYTCLCGIIFIWYRNSLGGMAFSVNCDIYRTYFSEVCSVLLWRNIHVISTIYSLSSFYHQPSLYHCSWFRLFIFLMKISCGFCFACYLLWFPIFLLTYVSLHMSSLPSITICLSCLIPSLFSRYRWDSFHIIYDK